MHPLKVKSQILVTLSGIVISVKLLQLKKASSPVLVTPSGMITAPVQALPLIKIWLTITNGFSACFASSQGVPSKANVPMCTTLSGIVISARLLQPLKANSSMLVTLSGIVIFLKLVLCNV
mgnify:CR=1 FL=1